MRGVIQAYECLSLSIVPRIKLAMATMWYGSGHLAMAMAMATRRNCSGSAAAPQQKKTKNYSYTSGGSPLNQEVPIVMLMTPEVKGL